jgi:CRP/FNR family transcriptional regulator, cyclic AMP receptor protein
MSSRAVYQQIAKHGFVAGLSPAWLRRLAACGDLVERPPQCRLFDDGDPADAFWLVRSGVVVLDLPGHADGHVRIDWLASDSVLGWSWLVPPYRFTLGAVVVEPMRAVEIRASEARKLLEQDLGVKGDFMARYVRVLGERLAVVRRRQALSRIGAEVLTKVPHATADRP